MKPFTTLRIFHGNCCIVHPTILSLKKIVLQEYILTITHKIQSFLLFSAFSHMSSLCQKFKALLSEEEKKGMRQKRERVRLKKEERGTALTQQNWERVRVLLKISSRSHWNPSVSRVPGQLGFGDTGTPAGQGATGSIAELPGMLWTCRKQNQHQAPHGCSPERVQLHLWTDTELGRGKGEAISSWQLPISC